MFSHLGRTQLFHGAKTQDLVRKTPAVYSDIRQGGEAAHEPVAVSRIRLSLQPNHDAM